MEWKWDWAIDSFKGGIGAVTIWAANRYRKPLYAWVKKQINLNKEVSEQKLRIEALEIRDSISDSKFMAYVHTDPTAVFITNAKREVIYVNPAWVKLIGYRDPESSYGYRFFDAIHPDDVAHMREVQQELINHPSGFEGNIRFVHRETKETINTFCISDLI